MDLKFLGRGAAFNPKEGNTSAYFIEKNNLFLIDCGESVFERIIKNNILESIQEINLMITHTHSDHIGSIGSLVMYSFYALHKPLNIILSKNAKHKPNIEKILNGFGCTKEMYNYIDERQFDNNYENFQNIRYIETKHSDDLSCYSIIFTTSNGLIYYSGDTKEIDTIKSLISSGKIIDKIYIDTTTDNYSGNVHLYIGILQKEIPKELKSQVYCMHLNNDECIKKAEKLGFNVVQIEEQKNRALVKKFD